MALAGFDLGELGQQGGGAPASSKELADRLTLHSESKPALALALGSNVVVGDKLDVLGGHFKTVYSSEMSVQLVEAIRASMNDKSRSQLAQNRCWPRGIKCFVFIQYVHRKVAVFYCRRDRKADIQTLFSGEK